jgi:hypothetical protein
MLCLNPEETMRISKLDVSASYRRLFNVAGLMAVSWLMALTG